MSNPANDPQYLANLLDRMEREPKVRAAIHKLFQRGELSFLHHDGQLAMTKIADAPDSGSEILILAARQTGKSFWALCYGISFALRHPKSVVRLFAPTELQANEITDDTLKVIEQFAPPGLIVKKKSDKRWAVGSSEIRIGPLSAAHIDGKRGGNAGLIILEEGGFAASTAYAGAISGTIGPQLLRSGGKLIHVTTPSEDVGHVIHTVILPKCQARGAVVRLTVHENPQLTPKQIEDARGLCFTEEAWRREYLAEILRSEISTACPEFTDDNIKAFAVPSHYRAWVAGDWGGVRDRTAFLLMAYDFARAKVLVLDECAFPKHTPTATIVAAVKAMEAKWRLVRPSRHVDCPGQLQVDLMTQHDFACSLPKKENFDASINLVRGAMRSLEIHPSCKALIQTLHFARLNKARTDFERTESTGHADALMALCYGLRHVNRQNPFPLYDGRHPSTLYIGERTLGPQSDSARVLKSLFTPR